MSLKIIIFIILISINIFAEMEIIRKIDFENDIYDVKINGGYAYIYGIDGIYLLDILNEENSIKKIISFENNDIPGKILSFSNYIALNYKENGSEFLSVFDVKNLKNLEKIFKAEIYPKSFKREREIEWFDFVNKFFLDENLLNYIDKNGVFQIYDIEKNFICPTNYAAINGYVKIKENKIKISKISLLLKVINCYESVFDDLKYKTGKMILDIMDNLNGLMEKYKEKAIAGRVGLWSDPPGVATQQLGFVMFDTSEVPDGYLILDNYFDYNWVFLGKYGWLADGEKQLYDPQDILVKNGYIYISSYSTCSIASADISIPWEPPGYIPGTDFAILENEENCYCFNLEECYIFNHPFGIDAANNKLYVANKKNLYIVKLRRDDEEYPRGGILFIPQKLKGTTKIIGWAEDSEGIKNVVARIGDFQFFNIKKDKGHKRPFNPNYLWKIEINTENIENGEYDLIILVEDGDGDFSIIHNDKIEIKNK